MAYTIILIGSSVLRVLLVIYNFYSDGLTYENTGKVNNLLSYVNFILFFISNTRLLIKSNFNLINFIIK